MTPTRVVRLRISPRSLVVAVALFGLTLAGLRLFAASTRVLGWIVVAAVGAGLLHPVVESLSRRIPRGVAVLVVALGVLGVVGLTAYGVVDTVVREARALEERLPRTAAQIERSPRFGAPARDFELRARTQRFVLSLPERLRGGTPAEALRAAATRGVAYLATAVLTLFFLLHGPRIARGALGQVRDERRRADVQRVAVSAYRRVATYARGQLLMSAAAGLLSYLLASAAHVPGAAPLGLWVALWDVVPLIGAAIGAAPIVVIAGVVSAERGFALLALFLAYQLLEGLVLQRRVEQRSLHVGPFLTVAAGLAGFELSGVAGTLLAVVALAGVAAVLDEVADSLDRGGAPEGLPAGHAAQTSGDHA